jgi:hypothetical protein
MIKKRKAAVISMAAACAFLAGWGCRATRDTVRVIDAKSGLPIKGAQVLPIYPSFAGAASSTDRGGVARIFIPRGGYGVQIWAPGYQTNFLGTFPTATNHNDWRGNQMDVSLVPNEK